MMKGNTNVVKNGFSLLEVIIGIGIMGIIMASCFTLLSQVMVINQKSKLEMMANEVMRSEMDVVRAKDWNAIVAMVGDSKFETKPSDSKYANTYTGTRKVSKFQGRDTQVEVILEVRWKDYKGVEHSINTLTLITKDGLQG